MKRGLLLLTGLAAFPALSGPVTSSCTDPIYRLWSTPRPFVLNYSLDTGSMALPGPSGTPVSDATARSAIAFAASVWSNANCCTGPSLTPPGISLVQGPDSPQPADPSMLSGPTGPSGINPIWVTSHDYPMGSAFDFASYPGTLAITYPFIQSGTTVVREEIIFNGFQPNAALPVRWYAGTTVPANCVDGMGCYNLETTAIHELGHFLGYAHSTCPGSVLAAAYGGRRQALAVSDVATVCGPATGYGHAVCPCAADSECPLGPCDLSATCTAAGCVTQHQVDGGSCSDSNPCTLNDTCQAGVCTPGTPVSCVAVSQCHLDGKCDPQTGLCSTPVRPNDAGCDDGNDCTSDSCQNGSCVGVALVDGSACSDGNACTVADACQAGVCIAGGPLGCFALDECHDIGTCDVGSGMCSNPPSADGTSCGGGRCVAGTCTASADAGAPDAGARDSGTAADGGFPFQDGGSSSLRDGGDAVNPMREGCGCGSSPGALGLLAVAAGMRRRRTRTA